MESQVEPVMHKIQDLKGEVSSQEVEEQKQNPKISSQLQENKQNQEQQQILLSSRPSKKLKYCVFTGNYPQYIRDAMAIRGNWQEVDPQVESIMAVDFIWKPFNFMKNVTITFFFDFFIIQGFELFDKRKDDIKRSVICYNHYEYISVLSTKTGLLQSLTDYYSNNKMAIDCNYTVADSLPMAFMITSNPNDFDFQVFRKKFQNIERGYVYKEKLAPKQFEQNFWLLKPANMNQGKGIEIFNTLKQIYSFLANKPQDQLWIVQKYIEKPLLYKQRKFDIRVLALGTNDYEIYFYNTGYMRTSSDNYTLDNKNKFVHLTNNCYQKHSNNYQKFEQGNQLTFQQFQEYLKDTFPDLEIPFDQIMLRMKDLIIDCFLAGINNFNPNKREHVFEVMGFDFMIDEDFRVWIIEVNTNPYFGVLNDQLPKFIDNLVDDTLRLTLDKVFPRDNPDSERPSQYELLYSQKQGINKRQGFDVGIYPVKSIKDKLVRQTFIKFILQDQERDLTLQKLNQLRSEQSQVLLLKQQTLQHKNLKSKANLQKNFYQTIEGSSRSKSALSFSQIDLNEPKRKQSKEKQTSKKFKNNQNLASDQKSTNKQNDELDVLNNNETSFKNLRKSQDSHQMTKIDELNEYKSQKITQSTMNTNDYLTNQNMHATVSKRTHQQPIGATSISVLLRKKAEEATRISQINQNDHLTKIQRILKVKDLIEQIKDSVSSIGDNVEQRKKDFNKYFNQICSALSNSSNVSKKDIQQALQGLKLLIFSQFLTQFNDKGNLTKIVDMLKINCQTHQEISEFLVKMLHELAKHYSIRQIFHTKKLLSKISRLIIENISIVQDDKNQFELNLHLIQFITQLSSVSNSKHYIPGETKEIEQLRRKAIQNGVLILVDVLYQISPEKQIKDKVKFDILDNLDLNDKKLHIYTVYEHFRQKVSYSQESQMSMRDSRLQLSQENKENITQKLAEISQRSMFQRIQDYIETNFKQVNPRIPSVLSQMDEHFNIKYLSDILDKYEQQINGNQSKLQQDTILPTVSGSKNLRNSPDFRKTMINNDSQESLERINIKKSSHQKQALNGKSVRNTIDGSYKSKQSRKEDRDIKSQESRESVQEYQRNQNNNVLMANQTYFANQDYISTANDLREYKSKMPINDTHRNTQYNVKSFERIKQSMRDVDILKRPLKQSKEKKVKSLRTQLNSKNRLPQLSDGTSEKEENNSMQYQNGYLTSKDHSLVLPNLANQQALESHNKKQLLYYGIGTNFQNQGGYNKVLQDANYYLKLHPYLQNNVRTSKNSNKKSFAHSVVKNDYQNLMHNQSSTVLFNQSKQDVKQSNPSILPLSQNTMKSNYYKSGYMSKIKMQAALLQSHQSITSNDNQIISQKQHNHYSNLNSQGSTNQQIRKNGNNFNQYKNSSIESKVYSNQKMGLKSVPLSQKSYGTGKNQSQIQSDAGSEMKSERYLDIMPTSVNEEITN